MAHGGLRDFDTVRAFEVVTMEDEPRVVLHEGAAVHEILHAWGTNGILTRIWFALAPAVEWTQLTAAFDTYDEAFRFTESIAMDTHVDQAAGDGLRVADSVVLHAGQAGGARRQIAGSDHDCQLRRLEELRAAAELRAEKLHLRAHSTGRARSRCSATTRGTTPRFGR